MSAASIFKMFGRSPIRPLQKQMSKVHACICELLPFFEAVIKEDWKIAKDVQKRVAKLESEADDRKRELRLNLPRNLFMPVPRIDVLELLSRQDALANKAKDLAGLVFGRKMVLPKVIQKNYLALIQRCIDASYEAKKIIKELDKLLEAGFSGKEVTYVEEMIDVLHNIERETDQMQAKIIKAVFAIENELPPVDVVFLYKVIEWTGDLADRARHVGDRVQILLAR
jgi:uncharacterized protein